MPENKTETIYVGSGKLTKNTYGEFLSLTLGTEDVKKILEWQKENNGWCKLDVRMRKTPSEKGSTHYCVINQFKPNSQWQSSSSSIGTGSTLDINGSTDSDNLPF